MFAHGFYGVLLFFAVSGFVIAMTLERTAGFVEFAVRRFARLWPAMLLCSGMTYLVLWHWPLFWPQQPINFLPSLTFLDGQLVWARLSPTLASHWIDGAYWSLFVEVRFYFYAGLVYFLARRHFVRNMAGFVLLVVAAYGLCRAAGLDRWVGILHDLAIAPFLPWFLLGMAAFQASCGRRRQGVALGLISLGLLAWLDLLDAPDASLPMFLAVATLFAGGLYWSVARRVLSMRWLTTVGVSSYSLYLLHQNLGLTLIAVLAEHWGLRGAASLWLAPVMAGAMIALAWLMYCYWEQPWNRWIVRGYKRLSQARTAPAGVTEAAR